MADTTPATPAEATTPKKGAKKAKKSDRPKSNHPATGVMVNAAIKELKERGGSSLQAIKKYISSTYKVDAEKMSPYIKKYLKSAVGSGALVQTKGKGASGSFKLPTSEKSKVKPKAKKPARAAPKPAKPATPKKAAPKKVAKPKKSPAAKKAASPKAAKPKSPKMKKVVKSPAKKPKVSKAKTTKPKTARSAKKASPKKK